MTKSFLVDEQLPQGLALRLTAAGYPALHVCDVLPPASSDVEVAAEANRRMAIVISKDGDFVELSTRGILQVQLLWLRVGNMTTIRLWEILQPLLPKIEASFAEGDRIVEVR